MTRNLSAPTETTSTALANYDAARAALATAHRVDEVKEIRDKAEAMRLYARMAQDNDMQRWAAEIKLRAERKAGEMLRAMEKHPGGRPSENPSQAVTSLSGLGISRMHSSRWQEAARLPEAEFETYLAAIKGDKMPSSSGLRNLVKIRAAKERHAGERGCTIDDLEALAFERPGAFAAILVDVPSQYKTFSEAGGGRSPERHYPTMPVEEIMAMGPIIRALAAEDTALFYWTSGPNFENAFRIVAAWGYDDQAGRPVFLYSTKAFAWVKQNPSGEGWHKGTGHWTHANGEEVLLFLKGHPPRLDTNVDELVIAPRGAHSAKPEAVRERIERLVPGPYLELFARTPRPGWTVWGNQVSEVRSQKSETPRGLAGGAGQPKEQEKTGRRSVRATARE